MEENFELTKIEEMIYARAAQKKLPIYGGFELTPYCNFNCKMCYIHETIPCLSILSADDWIEFGKQATEAGNLFIVLTGGEPLLHPEFKKIYTGLKKLGIVITINTNASLIDEDMADFLASDMPRRVNASLYGPNRDTYDQLCGNPDGFDKTIRAIELMLERKIPVKINIVPNKISFPYLDDMLKLCQKYNLTVEMTPYLFEPIRKLNPNKQLYRLNSKEMAEAIIKWHDYRYSPQEMITRAIICHQALENFDSSRNVQGTVPLRCRAGSTSFWLCWNGKMNTCVNMIQPQIDVKKYGFTLAWNKVKEESAKIQVSARCQTCSLRQFCLNCAAISYHQYDNFKKEPKIMCEVTQYYATKLATRVKRIERK